MAMTVTATMSGATANEHIYLWIRVLTGATEAGGASAANLSATGGTSVTASLTPNFSNSLPLYAITADNWGGSYTAAASNTIDSSSADPDTWGAGFGRYTGTVTATTPLTFGASGVGGSCDYSTWACYELLSSGGSTPSIDASSPVLASATGAGVKTVTSASFTPPAGSVVAAMVCAGGSGTSGALTIAVTDTGGGLTWTKRAGVATVADQNTAVFTATVPGGAATSPAAARQVFSRNWRRRHRRLQQMPGAPPPPPPSSGASLAITATAAASANPPCIAGLGGTGAGYFTDQGGSPRMVLGDAAWALPGNAGRWNSGNWQGDFDTYLATRAGQGFTVVYTKPIGTTQSGNIDNNGSTFDSLYPFQGGTPSTGVAAANPSSGLTSAFWARIDYFLASALAKGITVFLNAIGYDSDFESSGPLAGKSATEFQAYGTALGGRYASQPNLIWMVADDYFGGSDTKISSFLTGLRGAGDTHPIAIENMPESDSRNTFDSTPSALAWGTANAQFNFCYSYNLTYFGIERAYAETSPVPVIQGDGYFYQGGSTYAGGSGAFAYDRAIRQDAWHAISSGARGIIHGSESIWQWASTSLAASGTDWYYVHNAGTIRALMESLPGWHTLAPDASSALITAGRGTHASSRASGGGGGQYEVAFTDSYVTGSRTPDSGSGSALAVIYLSHGTTITIDQTKMVSGYTATWADPVTGATSAATAGSTYNSTAKGNNSQGDPDWVLILQAPASGTFTGTASLAVTATLAAAGNVATASGASLAATVTLTAAGNVATTSAASLTVTAALAAAGGASGAASLPVTATLTAAGTVATASGASLAATASLTAAPAGGAASAAALAVTAALAAAGGVAAASGASAAITAALSATGSATGGASLGVAAALTASGGAALSSGAALAGTVTTAAAGTADDTTSLAVTAALAAAGSVATASGAALAATVSLTATPAGGTASGASLAVTAVLAAGGTASGTASLPVTVTRAAAGSVITGPSGDASLAVTVTLAAAGNVATPAGAILSLAVTAAAAGNMAAARGATRTVTVTLAAAGNGAAAIALGAGRMPAGLVPTGTTQAGTAGDGTTRASTAAAGTTGGLP